MNPEVPHNKDSTFQEYRSSNEGSLSSERLSHYFNNELGTASNLIAALRSRVASVTLGKDLSLELTSKLDDVIKHLTIVHEIGNISLDLLAHKDDGH